MTVVPEWAMPCGVWEPGRHYVRSDRRSDCPNFVVSEVGHPAGLDLLAAGWPLMRLAAVRGDWATYATWEDRLYRVLEEYSANPPDPRWSECKVAPYVSANPGYHWARMLSMYLIAYLGASGYDVQP